MARSFRTVFFMFLFTFLSLTNAPVNAVSPMGLMTGGLQGTYYPFELNLKALMKNNTIDSSIVHSKGSVSNIYSVSQRPGTQMGIVQSDVLAFVAKVQTDLVLKNMAKKIRMVFPLYNEEIHLVGKMELMSFDDLQDKNVDRFGLLLKDNLELLKNNEHPKWNSVDLAYPLKG